MDIQVRLYGHFFPLMVCRAIVSVSLVVISIVAFRYWFVSVQNFSRNTSNFSQTIFQTEVARTVRYFSCAGCMFVKMEAILSLFREDAQQTKMFYVLL